MRFKYFIEMVKYVQVKYFIEKVCASQIHRGAARWVHVGQPSAELAVCLQVKYVVELARSLGRFPSVRRIDLLTRLIADPAVDPGNHSYSVPEEPLLLPPHGGIGAGAGSGDGLSGAFIVRLPCGPSEQYLW